MSRKGLALSRRQALQQLGVLGAGAVAAACGNGHSGSTPAATPTRTLTPTSAPTSVPSATTMPTRTSTRLPSPTATATSEPTELPTSTASPTPEIPTPSATPTATVTPEQMSCVLTPQQTLGPFFIDVGLVRSDVREDRAGTPLRLALQLVDADGCAPIRDAVVNIWHADAAGAYSGFAGQPGGIDTRGETFLRGYQVTDANGRVEFTTIYPGWYTGRTVHIHVRIHLDSTTVLVSQLYFPDALTAAVHATSPYDTRGQADTTNATDAIARNGLDDLLLDIVEESGGYAGSIVLGAAL